MLVGSGYRITNLEYANAHEAEGSLPWRRDCILHVGDRLDQRRPTGRERHLCRFVCSVWRNPRTARELEGKFYKERQTDSTYDPPGVEHRVRASEHGGLDPILAPETSRLEIRVLDKRAYSHLDPYHDSRF